MIRIDWCTADACGGSLYGPYSRRLAFDIRRRRLDDGSDMSDRQDVFLCLQIGNGKVRRLLRWRG